MGFVIKIGGGFGFPNRKVYPRERLIRFLEFDPKSEIEIGEFCTKYQIIPPNLFVGSKDIVKSFRIEQRKIKRIADKIIANQELDSNDIDEINNNIGGIRKSITLAKKEDVDQVNSMLSAECDELKDDHYVETFTHANSMVSLWEDLSQLQIKRNLKECINCHALFEPKTRHKRLFCGPLCANDYRQKRFRKRINK